jgi:hypothetical protein
MFTVANEAHKLQRANSREQNLTPKQISQRWLGFALRILQKSGVLRKWKQRRETDTEKRNREKELNNKV